MRCRDNIAERVYPILKSHTKSPTKSCQSHKISVIARQVFGERSFWFLAPSEKVDQAALWRSAPFGKPPGAAFADAAPRPSPNVEPRPAGAAPSLIVLHYTAMASAEAAILRLCDPQAKVSAHYVVDEAGSLWALAGETARAWHAGVSSWRGETDVNTVSIGIELAYPGEAAGPYPEPQIARLEAMLDALMARWELGPEAVLGHSDVAPGRKRDPGAWFPWRRLAAAGRARDWPQDGLDDLDAADEETFRRAARLVGYGDWPIEDLVDAVRLRARPEALRRPPRPERGDVRALEAI